MRITASFLVLLALADPSVATEMGQSTSLRSDTEPVEIPPLAKPGYLETVIDPVFGTKITRITGDPGAPIPNTDHRWPEISRHGYSARGSTWNRDGTYIYLEKMNPKLLLDGRDYRVIRELPRSEDLRQRRWSHTEPVEMIQVYSSGVISKLNVETMKETPITTVRGYGNVKIDGDTGNLSDDGRWVPLSGVKDGTEYVFAADLHTSTTSTPIDYQAHGIGKIDFISMSSEGTYIVLCGWIDNETRDRTWVFDRRTGVLVDHSPSRGEPSHYDVATDENGDEVIVGISKSGPNTGYVIKRRLSDGKQTRLTAERVAAQHTSCRNLDRPGWCFTAAYNDSPVYNKYEIMAVRLDGKRVERIAHTRSERFIYVAESQANPSPDGLRAVFASSWGRESLPVQAYVVDLRQSAEGASDAAERRK